MSDSGSFSYDEMPYTDTAFSQTHPDRLAALASLCGIAAPAVESSRVLELGCASGGNLIPMALTLPGATFLGIDLSAKQVELGQEKIQSLNLKNIELRHTSITDVDASFGKFDYILCHGVYSWVPEAVREKILAICSENLSPLGIAYVSYNTLPGWHLMGMVRDMMIYHSARFEGPATKVHQARALLDFLAQSTPPNTPYGMMLNNVLNTIRPQMDTYIFHEYLEDVNEPVYFHQFAKAAARHGLQYLTEADFGASVLNNLPPEVAETLRRIAADFLQVEQYMDFVRHRRFRQSLLTHHDTPVTRSLEGDVLSGLYIASAAKPMSPKPSLAQGTAERFQLRTGATAKFSNAVTKAAFVILAEHWPRLVPFEQLCAMTTARLGNDAQSGDKSQSEQIRVTLRKDMLQCYAEGIVELGTSSPQMSTTPSARPTASPLARLQAERGRSVTNLRHESVGLDDFSRRLIRLLDGTRDRDALLAALETHIAVAGIKLGRGDKSATTRSIDEKNLRPLLDEGLSKLAAAALLVD